jgi:hypothetical protein
MDRLNDLRRFYNILDALEHKLGGKRMLESCNGRMQWPRRGVYFFFEAGENRSHSGLGPRVVRVGTHALKLGGQSTLWQRLSQHQGTIKGGGGNHRGSIFRLHVGTALINRDQQSQLVAKAWAKKSGAGLKEIEFPIEEAVSGHIRQMPFLWLAVEDDPGPDSLRGVIERNAIALLSNYHATDNPLDPSSPNWLGRHADREFVRGSGLWNVNHVTETYNPAFLEPLEELVNLMRVL